MFWLAWLLFFALQVFFRLVLQIPSPYNILFALGSTLIIIILLWVIRRGARLVWEWEQAEPAEPRRPRWPRRPPPLTLESLTLILEERDGSRSLGRLVNPERVRAVRPVAVIQVNDTDLVGRSLPMEFRLTGPRRGNHYECRLEPVLKAGTNRVIPMVSNFPVSTRTPRGVWRIKLQAFGRVLRDERFTVTTTPVNALEQAMGADNEKMPEAERLAQELAAGSTIEDLLREE